MIFLFNMELFLQYNNYYDWFERFYDRIDDVNYIFDNFMIFKE